MYVAKTDFLVVVDVPEKAVTTIDVLVMQEQVLKSRRGVRLTNVLFELFRDKIV